MIAAQKDSGKVLLVAHPRAARGTRANSKRGPAQQHWPCVPLFENLGAGVERLAEFLPRFAFFDARADTLRCELSMHRRWRSESAGSPPTEPTVPRRLATLRVAVVQSTP